jgi:dTDP-4-dehydrorhamnose reductase
VKILVTGSQGQLARSLVERGEGRPGIELVVAGRPALDLERPGSAAAIVAAAAPDVVINAAAYTAVDQAEDEPDRAMRINGDAAGEVAAAARAAGAAVIQISTDYVFDGRADQPYAEDAPANPLGAYGRSKREGELRVRAENPRHLIVRTAWVYGPFASNFVKTMLRIAATRDKVTVVDDQVGNPSSALDLADGLLAIIDRWGQGRTTGIGETYHLAGSGEASWSEFASAIFAECRKLGLPAPEVQPIASQDWPTKAVRPANSRLDCRKFAGDFGFAMPEWRQSLRTVVDRLAKGSIPAR